MEIINKGNIDTCYTINDLKEGDLFLYQGYVHMKILEHDDINANVLNAILLENPCSGECCFVCEDDIIIPLDATLEIRRRDL